MLLDYINLTTNKKIQAGDFSNLIGEKEWKGKSAGQESLQDKRICIDHDKLHFFYYLIFLCK